MEFKHPKYYKELRKLRNKMDQEKTSCSCDALPEDLLSTERLVLPTKLQAASLKRQASEAPSGKPQAPTSKLQASSPKRQAPRFVNHGTWILKKF